MLRVSTHTNLITPNESCYLAGYSMRTEKSQGVLDDLKCTALVIQIDHKVVVNVDVEVLMVSKSLVDNVKARLVEMYNLEPDFITIAAIHTHAAPEIRVERIQMHDDSVDPSFWNGYKAFLEDTIVDTVKACFDKGFEDVQAFFRTVEIDGLYGNRNGIGKPEDKDVTIVKFVGEGNNVKAAIVNISCHPTVLSPKNLLISGDLLGFISRRVQAVFGVYPLMMQGAAGDMSNRNYREGNDPRELKRTGMGIVRQMFDGEEGYQRLFFTTPTVETYNYYREYDIDLAEWQARREELVKAMEAETNYDKHKIYQSSLFAVDMKINQFHITADYNASIIRMGDFVVCKMPGELFSRFGKQIKEASPAKLPVIWGYADDYAGYMADEGEYGRTYESLMSPLPKGGTEEITAEICELIAKN